MDITYRFRKINSNVFQNALMPVFTLNGCTCIAKESRWIDSPLPSPHTHTYYTYTFPRVSLASLTYIHRETHMPIVKLHVHPDHIGADIHIHNRDIEILCTLHWGQTLRQKCTKLYGGNLPNCTAAMYQTVRRQCTKLYGDPVELGQLPVAPEELIPNLTAAMYQTVRRQCTNLYSGNVPNCTAAIGVGGVVAPWQNTLEKVESPNLPRGGGILL